MFRFTLVILLARAATERATAHQSSMYSLQGTTSSGILNNFTNTPFPDVRQFLGIVCSSSNRSVSIFSHFCFHSNASMNTADISPAGYPRTYHDFELPLTFGTAGECHGVPSSYEDLVSIMPQDPWLDFAKDSHHGLRIVGWSPFPEGKVVLIGRYGDASESKRCIRNRWYM